MRSWAQQLKDASSVLRTVETDWKLIIGMRWSIGGEIIIWKIALVLRDWLVGRSTRFVHSMWIPCCWQMSYWNVTKQIWIRDHVRVKSESVLNLSVRKESIWKMVRSEVSAPHSTFKNLF